METLKDLIKDFAGNNGYTYRKYIKVIDEYKQDGENLSWEKGFIRGFEYLCSELLFEIEKSNNKLITKDTILHLLEN